ncbi:DUF4123 domain-containing protein [Paraburkholderia acidipaludis]|uniref:DUF4123 domain-containing protein n=1 Tax=Paraburkholderia acidipaludis TaxID=660537 RepID=UPI0006935B1D|nr:DUF4123 domain-containing protein [Paraburkholderia acidipaludis]
MHTVPFQVERFTELTQWLKALTTGHDTPIHLYALVDGVLDPDVLQVVIERDAAWQCLYPETMLEASSPDVAPYLVEIKLDDASHAALARTLLRKSEHVDLVLWVASRASLSRLTRHLHPFAEVALADGRHALLRYYDPLILEALLDALTPAQREWLVAPLRAIRYWHGGWKDVNGSDRESDGLVVTADHPMLTTQQQQRLAVATLAETVYHEIKGELLPPMSDIDARSCIAHARELLDRAYERYQFHNMDDLMLFTLIGLNIGREFDAHPTINVKLDPRQRAGKPLREILPSISPDAWEEAAASSWAA